ncbi:hypothetical protein HUJ05_012912 [Dendroctonus ponderosae]|nr:hypothetical protein HUJ05_012912 [Dendroctonus ponderosae]
MYSAKDKLAIKTVEVVTDELDNTFKRKLNGINKRLEALTSQKVVPNFFDQKNRVSVVLSKSTDCSSPQIAITPKKCKSRVQTSTPHRTKNNELMSFYRNDTLDFSPIPSANFQKSKTKTQNVLIEKIRNDGKEPTAVNATKLKKGVNKTSKLAKDVDVVLVNSSHLDSSNSGNSSQVPHRSKTSKGGSEDVETDDKNRSAQEVNQYAKSQSKQKNTVTSGNNLIGLKVVLEKIKIPSNSIANGQRPKLREDIGQPKSKLVRPGHLLRDKSKTSKESTEDIEINNENRARQEVRQYDEKPRSKISRSRSKSLQKDTEARRNNQSHLKVFENIQSLSNSTANEQDPKLREDTAQPKSKLRRPGYLLRDKSKTSKEDKDNVEINNKNRAPQEVTQYDEKTRSKITRSRSKSIQKDTETRRNIQSHLKVDENIQSLSDVNPQELSGKSVCNGSEEETQGSESHNANDQSRITSTSVANNDERLTVVEEENESTRLDVLLEEIQQRNIMKQSSREGSKFYVVDRNTQSSVISNRPSNNEPRAQSSNRRNETSTANIPETHTINGHLIGQINSRKDASNQSMKATVDLAHNVTIRKRTSNKSKQISFSTEPPGTIAANNHESLSIAEEEKEPTRLNVLLEEIKQRNIMKQLSREGSKINVVNGNTQSSVVSNRRSNVAKHSTQLFMESHSPVKVQKERNKDHNNPYLQTSTSSLSHVSLRNVESCEPSKKNKRVTKRSVKLQTNNSGFQNPEEIQDENVVEIASVNSGANESLRNYAPGHTFIFTAEDRLRKEQRWNEVIRICTEIAINADDEFEVNSGSDSTKEYNKRRRSKIQKKSEQNSVLTFKNLPEKQIKIKKQESISERQKKTQTPNRVSSSTADQPTCSGFDVNNWPNIFESPLPEDPLNFHMETSNMYYFNNQNAPWRYSGRASQVQDPIKLNFIRSATEISAAQADSNGMDSEVNLSADNLTMDAVAKRRTISPAEDSSRSQNSSEQVNPASVDQEEASLGEADVSVTFDGNPSLVTSKTSYEDKRLANNITSARNSSPPSVTSSQSESELLEQPGTNINCETNDTDDGRHKKANKSNTSGLMAEWQSHENILPGCCVSNRPIYAVETGSAQADANNMDSEGNSSGDNHLTMDAVGLTTNQSKKGKSSNMYGRKRKTISPAKDRSRRRNSREQVNPASLDQEEPSSGEPDVSDTSDENASLVKSKTSCEDNRPADVHEPITQLSDNMTAPAINSSPPPASPSQPKPVSYEQSRTNTNCETNHANRAKPKKPPCGLSYENILPVNSCTAPEIRPANWLKKKTDKCNSRITNGGRKSKQASTNRITQNIQPLEEIREMSGHEDNEEPNQNCLSGSFRVHTESERVLPSVATKIFNPQDRGMDINSCSDNLTSVQSRKRLCSNTDSLNQPGSSMEYNNDEVCSVAHIPSNSLSNDITSKDTAAVSGFHYKSSWPMLFVPIGDGCLVCAPSVNVTTNIVSVGHMKVLPKKCKPGAKSNLKTIVYTVESGCGYVVTSEMRRKIQPKCIFEISKGVGYTIVNTSRKHDLFLSYIQINASK